MLNVIDTVWMVIMMGKFFLGFFLLSFAFAGDPGSLEEPAEKKLARLSGIACANFDAAPLEEMLAVVKSGMDDEVAAREMVNVQRRVYEQKDMFGEQVLFFQAYLKFLRQGMFYNKALTPFRAGFEEFYRREIIAFLREPVISEAAMSALVFEVNRVVRRGSYVRFEADLSFLYYVYDYLQLHPAVLGLPASLKLKLVGVLVDYAEPKKVVPKEERVDPRRVQKPQKQRRGHKGYVNRTGGKYLPGKGGSKKRHK